jgi:hypothetical protein
MPTCVEKNGCPFFRENQSQGKTTGSADKDERLGHVRSFYRTAENATRGKNRVITNKKTSPRKAGKRSVMLCVFFRLAA